MTKVLHVVQSDFISSLRDSLSISLKWDDSVQVGSQQGNTDDGRVGAAGRPHGGLEGQKQVKLELTLYDTLSTQCHDAMH